MLRIKRLRLKNYCGYKDTTFNFCPNGRWIPMAIFFGPNGIGKCLTGNEFIITDNGMVKIKSLFLGKNLKEDTWYDYDCRVAINGEFANVKKIYYNGKKKTVKVKTKSGLSLEGSYDLHQILRVEDSQLKFGKLADLCKNDFVCISRKSIFPEKSEISTELARVMGYLVSEGCCSLENLRFFNTDNEVNNDFCQCVNNTFNSNLESVRYPSNPGCGCVSIPSDIRRQIYNLGVLPVLSGDKTVPSTVLAGTKEIVCSFLRAYFEGDGGVEPQMPAITCASKSKQLLQEIQLLLLRLGIVSVLKQKDTEKLSYVDKPYTSFRLFIQGENIIRFHKEIGFISYRKQQEISNIVTHIESTNRNPNTDIIPSCLVRSLARKIKATLQESNVKFCRADYKNSSNGLHCLQQNYLSTVKNGVSISKIKACIETVNNALEQNSGGVALMIEEPDWLQEDYFFDQVESIEYGENDLFDICVEEEHCYWSNGFISHNSTGLNAIRLLTAGKEFKGRDMDLVLRSLVHNDEYNPDLSGYTPPSEEMLIEGVFDENGEEKVVRIEALYWEVEHVGVRPTPTDFIGHEYCMVNCRVKGEMKESDSAQEWIITMFQGGFVKNDLESKQEKSVLFLDSDNPINMKKFQIPETRAKLFIDMAEAVYGYPCLLSSPVVSGVGNKEMKFFADFILGKGGGKTKIHFKRMSDGEKKIATMLRTLCNPTEIDEPDIILIDNIEMHIYFKRHPKLVEKLLECFPNKQFLVTTHSAVLIQYVMERNADRNEQNWLFDIEQYKPQEAMTL